MKMQTATVIGLFGGLILAGSVSAIANEVKVYELSVSVHEAVEPLEADKVKQKLETMSHILQHCDVKFTLHSIGTFGSPAPKHVHDLDSLEAVHSVPGDVKIVDSITFCRPDGNNNDGTINGCTWRAKGLPRTIILRRGAIEMANLWAHEFGHTKGLPHRDDVSALMFCRPGFLSGRTVTEDECKCVRDGCPIPALEPDVQCSQ